MNRPAGTVTFLFTDIEGSTKLWEDAPEAMRLSLARHDALLREAIERANGYVFKTVGDAFCAAFTTATEALAAALAAQFALAAEPWSELAPIRVRMALHTGAVESRDGDYFGQPLNRVARLLATGHGGQSLLSLAASELVRDALPSGVELRSLGEHRLKDLGRPESIFQLCHPSLASEFAPLKSLDNAQLRHNLPQQVTSFVGREEELAQIRALLAKTRLLTLTGSGGCGKTRLTLQVAAELLDGDGDGAWLVELAPLADPTLVVQTVADVLGVKESAGKPLLQTLTEYLKSKRLLLVLDNCEHLIDACAKLTDTLIRQCPGVQILASSREALGIAGELTYRVPSLSLPDPRQQQTPESLSQYEAVQLFIERALLHQPTFSVTNANAPALTSICHRLDGIPLAIELAAARVRSLSVEEINTKLDQRFRLLTGGSRTALPRQQTLRSLIDWSYDLLSEAERALLCRLSVFAGGWILESAEQVCSGDAVEDWEVLDLLTSLYDKSLVVAEPSGSATRYRLLETVRQYSHDRLVESGEEVALRERHLAHFLALAETARPQLTGPDQTLWLDRLEREHDNFRAALRWSGDAAASGVLGVQLAGTLWRFWDIRAYIGEGRAHLAQALERYTPGQEQETYGRAFNGAGVLAMLQGDHAEARALFTKSLAFARELGDRQGIASGLGNLGNIAMLQGDYAAARVIIEECVALYRELDRRWGIATALGNLAAVVQYLGDYAAARAFREESIALYRELGDQWSIAWSLCNLGHMTMLLGDYAAAHVSLEESVALYRELGDQFEIGKPLCDLGTVTLWLGDAARARALFEESLALYQGMRDRSHGLAILGWLPSQGELAHALGEYTLARSFHEEHLLLSRELARPEELVVALLRLGMVAPFEGGDSSPIRACRLWGASERLGEQLGRIAPAQKSPDFEDALARVRALLSDDAAFDVAWAEGRALTLEQAIELALEKQKVG